MLIREVKLQNSKISTLLDSILDEHWFGTLFIHLPCLCVCGQRQEIHVLLRNFDTSIMSKTTFQSKTARLYSQSDLSIVKSCF